MNGNKFEYVASGLNYTRITYDTALIDSNPDLKNFIIKGFDKMQTIGKNHTFSLLFNGWTEVPIGQLFQKFKDNIPDIYSDSGGLQVFTQGKKITEELKLEVYKAQANYSSKAFIFDEPPIGTYTNDTLSKHDTINRWFDSENLVATAKETGKNVAKQLETFDKMNSSTKSMIILHGNCFDSYQKTLDIIMKQIPKEHHRFIHGIAMGGGVLGSGILEDVKRIFYFSQLDTGDCPINQLHILGFGSINRSFPFLMMSQNGVFNNMNISYDSTTHTSGLTQGGHWMNMKENKMIIGKMKNKNWERMYENVCENFDLDISYDDYYDYCVESSYRRIQEKYADGTNHIKCYYATAMSSIINFIKHMEKMIESKDTILEYLDNPKNKNIRHLRHLYEVKTMDDFKHWENKCGKYLPSKPVLKKVDAPEDFFMGDHKPISGNIPRPSKSKKYNAKISEDFFE